ncbi:MAG: hypothetical protein D6706_00985 [Chloroflexi bacterium]|nr:MAG: hypothetical protein D6706_00985 [Chloroflexota bacterium]
MRENCPHCHQPLSHSRQRLCPHCGQPLATDETLVDAPVADTRQFAWLSAATLVALAGVILLAGTAVYLAYTWLQNRPESLIRRSDEYCHHGQL